MTQTSCLDGKSLSVQSTDTPQCVMLSVFLYIFINKEKWELCKSGKPLSALCLWDVSLISVCGLITAS